MGTSSARRGPTTALWRAAKGAATRYLSPEGGGAVTAQEVVARYLAALEETPGQGDRLAVFRFTRKVAQDLGTFGEEVKAQGWEKALQNRGLASLAHSDAALLAQGVSGVLAGGGGGLEEAVVRVALARVLQPMVQSKDRMEPVPLVRQFLVTALTLRLVLDLGESLEAAAGSYGRLKDGLARLKGLIEVDVLGTEGEPVPPATPEHWQGLPGWTWVTASLAALMAKLGQ